MPYPKGTSRCSQGLSPIRIRIRRVALAHTSDSLIAKRPEDLVHEIHNM